MRAPRRLLLVGGAALLAAAGVVVLRRTLTQGPPDGAAGATGTLEFAESASATGAPGDAPSAAGEPGEVADAGGEADADGGDAGEEVDEPEPATLAEQRERLFQVLSSRGLSAAQVAAIRAIFEASPDLSQGNPAVTVHPMTRAECRKRRAEAKIVSGDPGLCGERYMVPIFDPAAGETRESARVCIDQYEFPGVPCEYPVVHVRAGEAAAICRAAGERLCDAHEWEGACAGAVHAPEVEYSFKHDRQYSSGMHNLKREIVWAYGATKNHGLCGTTSFKTKGCPGGGWKQCGSNTFPTGAFPACKSAFGVYDQHGNAAEHMNLPTRPEELMSTGPGGGLTEMKGSWFIFSKGEPHLDDCRWREPSWHESKVSDPNSHKNYHLGFRCCKDRT